MTKRFLFSILCVLLISTVGLASVFAGGEEEAAGADEKVTLDIITFSGSTSTMALATSDMPVYKEYERLTGIDVNWEVIEKGTYRETMMTRIAAGVNMPDIFYTGLLGVSYFDLGADGVIIPIDDLIDEYAPNLQKFWAENPDQKMLSVSPIDGKIYGGSGLTQAAFLSQGILYNKVWLDELGLDLPETLDEFYEVLVAFRDNDPNGNGKADEIALSVPTWWYLFQMAASFGFEQVIAPPYQVDENGRVFGSRTHPQYKDFVAFMAKLYAEGLFDQNYYNVNWDIAYEKIANDTVGAFFQWTTNAGNFSIAHPASGGDINVPVFVPGPPLKTPDGEQYFIKRFQKPSTIMGITTAAENPGEALRFIDFIQYSDEALMLQNFGIEGVSYNMVNGKPVPITVEGKTFTQVLNELGGSQPPFPHIQWKAGWDQQFPQWLVDYNDEYQQYYKDPSFPLIHATAEENATLAKYKAEVNPYFDEMFAKFVTGQEPMSSWDEMVNTMNEIGQVEIIEVMQQQYDRYVEMMGK